MSPELRAFFVSLRQNTGRYVPSGVHPTQALELEGRLNVGGLSEAVFSLVASFLSGDVGRFAAEVEAIEL